MIFYCCLRDDVQRIVAKSRRTGGWRHDVWIVSRMQSVIVWSRDKAVPLLDQTE